MDANEAAVYQRLGEAYDRGEKDMQPQAVRYWELAKLWGDALNGCPHCVEKDREIEQLHQRIDAGIDELYAKLGEFKDLLDSYNVLLHRKPL